MAASLLTYNTFDHQASGLQPRACMSMQNTGSNSRGISTVRSIGPRKILEYATVWTIARWRIKYTCGCTDSHPGEGVGSMHSKVMDS